MDGLEAQQEFLSLKTEQGTDQGREEQKLSSFTRKATKGAAESSAVKSPGSPSVQELTVLLSGLGSTGSRSNHLACHENGRVRLSSFLK